MNIKFKRVLGKHAYEILVSIGFICLVLVCWRYSRFEVEDTKAFWLSVYPSAYVDIISVVVSTILITGLINKKNRHDDKKRLYAIIKYAHNNLFAELYGGYILVLKAGKDKGEIKGLNNPLKIKNYLNQTVTRDFNHEEIIRKKLERKVHDGIVFEKEITETIARAQLFNEYNQKATEIIDDFIKGYQNLLTIEYLSILVEVKERLRENPFLVFNFDEDDEYCIPVFITEKSIFVKNNIDYITKVFSLHEYFLDVR